VSSERISDKIKIKPINWYWVLKALAALVGFAVALLTLFSFLTPLLPDSFSSKEALRWVSIILLMLLIAIIIYAIFSHQLFAEEIKVQELELKIKNLKDLLRESEERKNTDVITGVPNEEKLKIDLDSYFKRPSRPDEAQLVMIDLVDFKKTNEKYGFLFGDEVLRYVAQRIYCEMRRSESMYRYFHDQSKDPLWTRFYRKYPGGDEFLFLLEGDMCDAMGFIVRLNNSIFKDLSNNSEKTLGVNVAFKFHCAIVTVQPSDDYKTATRKVSSIFKRLNTDDKPSLAWYPENYFDFNVKKEKIEISKRWLEEAKKIFSISNIKNNISPT